MASEEDLRLFRIFKLDEGCEVWVGKNSETNDLLTFKYTNQFDLWFHVRGSSGSHTVLKPPGKDFIPSKEAIRTAASIAAYYSKSKKGRNIPVAYTHAKNVQKYKGAEKGSVVLKNEKIIKVNPELP